MQTANLSERRLFHLAQFQKYSRGYSAMELLGQTFNLHRNAFSCQRIPIERETVKSYFKRCERRESLRFTTAMRSQIVSSATIHQKSLNTERCAPIGSRCYLVPSNGSSIGT